MRVPLPPLEAPRVLGVDDVSLYGSTYGTLLVDATIRLPLTLWEGRDAEQLSRWLHKHPSVEVACPCGSVLHITLDTAGCCCPGCGQQHGHSEVLQLPVAERRIAA